MADAELDLEQLLRRSQERIYGGPLPEPSPLRKAWDRYRRFVDEFGRLGIEYLPDVVFPLVILVIVAAVARLLIHG